MILILSKMNSLVARQTDSTFVGGPTGTWVDNYIDNPNYNFGSLWDGHQRSEDVNQTRLAGIFTLPELQLLSQVVNNVPDYKNKIPDHMMNAPSIKNTIPP